MGLKFGWVWRFGWVGDLDTFCSVEDMVGCEIWRGWNSGWIGDLVGLGWTMLGGLEMWLYFDIWLGWTFGNIWLAFRNGCVGDLSG